MEYKFIFCGSEEVDDILQAPFKMYGGFTTLESCMEELDSGSIFTKRNNMLIVDCGNYDSVSDFSSVTGYMKSMLENDQPVLLYKPLASHKRMLVENDVVPACITDSALALCLMPQRDENGNLHVAMYEHWGLLDAPACCERTLATIEDDNNKITPVERKILNVQPSGHLTISDLKPFIDTLSDAMHTLVKEQRIEYTAGSSTPPDNIPKTLWFNSPINIYATITPCGQPYEGFTPPAGRMVLEMGMNVGGYYDNLNYDLPIQMVNIVSLGHMTTTMNDNTSDRRGWSIANVEIDGDNISSDEIVSVSSSPNNTSGSSTYTSGSEFNIGLSAGTEGLASNASYTISHSVSREISDWTDVQLDPNSWLFKQQSPYDGTATGFPGGAAGTGGVSNLPPLSQSCLYLNTNTVWRQHPASSRKTISISYKFNVTARYTWAKEHNSTKWSAWSWWYKQSNTKTINIALKNAYPKK